jgi:hypothetical protein
VLVIIALVVISIFFPPAWFALVTYVVYLALTKSSRRNKVIFSKVRELVATGKESAVLSQLFYESAKSFAAENGASMSPYKNDPEDDCLIVNLVIDGIKYNVCFQRGMKGETLLTVETEVKTKEDIINSFGKDSHLAELLNK